MKLSLDAWRRARNISQKEMAEACNVSIVTYQTWERNPGKIKIDNAICIADKLQIPLDDIILSVNSTEDSNTIVSTKEET